MDKKLQNRTAILGALQKIGTPAHSTQVAKFLSGGGRNLSERTVRLYFAELDAEGLTEPQGKRRAITSKGLSELYAADTFRRVGCLAAKIDQKAYSMTLDIMTRTGLVVANMSLVEPHQLAACEAEVCRTFAQGYAMGNLLTLLGPGESLGDWVVPPGKLGLCTICSITLNGVLIKHGVPVTSRFGGLLELQDRRPTRFTEMIHYEGTSIDPLEIFIRGGMTNYCGAMRDGNGLIGASFREIPENSRDVVVQLIGRLSAIGLGGILEIGWPEQPVLEVPVTPGRIGVVMIGGLSPAAILEEYGHRVHSRALAGLLDFSRLFHYEEFSSALKRYL